MSIRNLNDPYPEIKKGPKRRLLIFVLSLTQQEASPTNLHSFLPVFVLHSHYGVIFILLNNDQLFKGCLTSGKGLTVGYCCQVQICLPLDNNKQ